MTDSNNRHSEYPIDPMFLDRWSPRAFSETPMDSATLLTILEAGRWAPSASNYQPWRFVYALKGGEDFEDFLGLLNPSNQVWAASASALVFILSDTVMRKPDGSVSRTLRSHSFDAGAAWAMLALQALKTGYAAHCMGGVDFDTARQVLQIPEDFHIEAAVAIGQPADRSTLAAELRDREVPNSRKPLANLAFEGRFRG